MKYLVYILTFIIWIGSMILSFFAGLITMEVIDHRAKNRKYINYSGVKSEAKEAK